MTRVYDQSGAEIGWFNGTFVVDEYGEKLYLVIEHDVFCVPRNDDDSPLPNPPCVGIGELDGGTAFTDNDEIIFSLNRWDISPGASADAVSTTTLKFR